MRLKAILVLDLGTTNIKAIVYNEEGSVQAESSAPTPVIYEGNRMEIHPSSLWNTTKIVCKSVLSKVDSDVVVSAVSISSMAATLIPIDEKGMPVYNAIGRADGRPLEKMNIFLEKFNTGYRIKGCGQYPLPMYAAFKIPWFNDKVKNDSSRIYKWINVSDFICSKLTGVNKYYTDYSIASRTMLFDDINKVWNEEALKEFEIEKNMLPEPVPAGTIVGEIGEEGCSIGFNKGTMVVIGGHDHMCASLGAALTKPGILLNSTGTSEAMITMLPKPYHIEDLPSYWINCESSLIKDEIMAVSYTSASGQIYSSALDTFLDCEKKNINPRFESYKEPLKEPIYIPSLRSSLPSALGSFILVPTNFNGEMMTQAVIEGIYYESRRVCERISSVQKLQVSRVRIVGGQTKDDAALQLKCNILGLPIERPREVNISAKGAFILAAASCGIFSSVTEGADNLYSLLKKDIFYPDERKQALYYEIYKDRYLTYFNNGVFSL